MFGHCYNCESEEMEIEGIELHRDALKKCIAEHKYPFTVDDVEEVVCCVKCHEISDILEEYKPEFRPENQKTIVDGICINPAQRCFFDNLHNDLRPEQEHDDWFDVPYIVTSTYRQNDATYAEHVKRAQDYNFTATKSETAWLANNQKEKDGFYNAWPSGTCYTVRCYDGGAWDRSTWRGSFKTQDEALAFCKQIA